MLETCKHGAMQQCKQHQTLIMPLPNPHHLSTSPPTTTTATAALLRLLTLAEAYGLLQEPLTGLSLQQFLAMHCQEALLTRGIDVGAVTAEVAKLAVQRHVAEGHTLFSFGEVPDSFFLMLQVCVYVQLGSESAGLNCCPHGRHVETPNLQADALLKRCQAVKY